MWRPTANESILEARARLLAELRSFFTARHSLEVDVPVIGKTPASDPWLDSFQIVDPAGKSIGYLLTSPETYLKRLLAQYRRSIHSITKAYRANEVGSDHAVEFTMLEWYRPTSVAPFRSMILELQDLVEEFTLLGRPQVLTYRELFESQFGLNPHKLSATDVIHLANDFLGAETKDWLDSDSVMNILFSDAIEPRLTNHLVTDFPIMQAALSRIESDGTDMVAKRVELYLLGSEIANGYFELTDAAEQSERFDRDNVRRAKFTQPQIQKDDALIDALTAGLPESYGVALGVDRLLKIIVGAPTLAECMTFTGYL